MNRSYILSKDKILILIFTALTILIVGLAIVGGFRSYSPVPFCDDWEGILKFFIRVQDDDNAVWWEQFHEHRIVLARLLFWANFKWLGGENWPLITINYLLVGLVALVFWRILRNLTKTAKPTTIEIVLGLFMTAWLFLWIQNENLTISFQSQFILAQLLPLCALYWLHKSVANIHADRYFLIACGFGLASVGTMANGILALPLMAFYSMLTRQSLVRICILTTLSIVTLFIYFHGYQSPVNQSSLAQALKENPIGLLKFILLYLGSPFYFLFKESFTSWYLSQYITYLAGFTLIFSSTWLTLKLFSQKLHKNSLKLALLFFILYIGGSALGTASGRLHMGVSYALATSRYTTPALMAWATLLVIYAPDLLSAIKINGKKCLLPLAMLGFLMIPLQFQALQSQNKMVFEQKIAALALELGVKDKSQIVNARYYEYLDIIEKASAQNLSIFGLYPFRDVKEQFGVPVQNKILPTCQGELDVVEAIDDERRFIRVSGWISNPSDKITHQAVRFLDNQNKVVGYALTGLDKPNIADQKALKTDYQGYLLADQMGKVLTLLGEKPPCQMQVNIPALLYSLATTEPSAERTTISNANILSDNQWQGSDFARSVIDGMHVYGSFINSDADVGSISLHIKRGNRIFYRTGPTGGHQFLEVSGSTKLPIKLPVATEWTLLEFNNVILPSENFIVKFADYGTNMGEWAAIAVKN